MVWTKRLSRTSSQQHHRNLLDWTNQSIDREVYYTLTCFYPPYCDDFGCYPAREDTRLHSANSLTTPVIEDNQAQDMVVR